MKTLFRDRNDYGFTGTQSGMTVAQQLLVHRLFIQQRVTDLHHGDCVGSDDQADQLARELGLVRHLHIPSNNSRRSFCIPSECDVVYPPKPYLERNRDIVDLSIGLIATPRELHEVLRSGTWSTVRYAKLKKKPVWIVWPDGTLTYLS